MAAASRRPALAGPAGCCPAALFFALAFTISSADSGFATLLADLQLPQLQQLPLLQQHDCFGWPSRLLPRCPLLGIGLHDFIS